MKRITAWQTCDGILWPNKRAAASHADKRYGVLLSKLAHDGARVEKYMDMIEWLESRAADFEQLALLKADMTETAPYGDGIGLNDED